MADPFVTLNGEEGEFFSRADDNLLDADTAHAAQSQWVNALGGDVTDTNGHFEDGFGWTRATLNSAGASSLRRIGLDSPTVDAGVFTVSCDLEIEVDTPQDFRIRIVTTTDNLTTVAQTFSSGKHRFGGQVTLQAGDVTAIWIEMNTAGTAGDFYEASRFMMEEGDVDTVFVPSLRIVGDLDMRAEMLLTNWSTIWTTALLTRDGNAGFSLKARDIGVLFAQYGDGLTDRGSSSIAHNIPDGTLAEIRATFEITGLWTWYVDGNSIGTSANTAGAGEPVDNQLFVAGAGAIENVDGDVFFAEIRDGIDGPIVYRFDAADVLASVV